MKILALEFSSAQRSVALVVDGQVRGRAQETGTRESRALSLIETALAAAGLERENVDCLAIGLGPGSYTGIRSAIALAQGWQLARGTKILGISSVESLAAQARTDAIAFGGPGRSVGAGAGGRNCPRPGSDKRVVRSTPVVPRRGDGGAIGVAAKRFRVGRTA